MFFLFGKNMFGDITSGEIFPVSKVGNFLITENGTAFGSNIILQQTD